MKHRPSSPTGREKEQPYRKLIAANRRARHDYIIEETVEAGLELRGSEVKSLRQGKVNFSDAYARIHNDECWLIGLHLATYAKTFVEVPDPLRRRRLLLNKREIRKLRARSERAGCTLVPLEVYFRGSWAKVSLGVARGKSKGDKRQALKASEAKREIQRTLKNMKKK